jgi:hypothetical protein
VIQPCLAGLANGLGLKYSSKLTEGTTNISGTQLGVLPASGLHLVKLLANLVEIGA